METQPEPGCEPEPVSETNRLPDDTLEERDAMPGTSAPDAMLVTSRHDDAERAAEAEAEREFESSLEDQPGELVGSETQSGPAVELESGAGPWADLIQAFHQDIAGRLEQLRQLFEREVRAEATRERIVDRLHAELQEYKGDLVLQCLRPIFLDLIGMYDDLGKRLEGAEPDGPAARLARELQQEILDVLYRQGVEPFTVDEAGFDPRRQRAIATVPTGDAALVRTLARRIRPGFDRDGKLIRPELVAVYVNAPAG